MAYISAEVLKTFPNSTGLNEGKFAAIYSRLVYEFAASGVPIVALSIIAH